MQEFENNKKILKILKSSIYNKELHKRVLSEPKGEPFLMINISVSGEENIEIIKKWLEEGVK